MRGFKALDMQVLDLSSQMLMIRDYCDFSFLQYSIKLRMTRKKKKRCFSVVMYSVIKHVVL